MAAPAGAPCHSALREILLERKGRQAQCARETWSENGASYFTYRDYIRYTKKKATEARQRQHETGSETSSSVLPSDAGSISGEQPDGSLTQDSSSPFTFVGMHGIFEASAAATTIMFARAPSDLVAFGTADGALCIASAGADPKVLFQLEGHTKQVAYLEWSADNQFLVSGSQDKTLRIWDVAAKQCVRIVYGEAEVNSSIFHPFNPNLLLVGFDNGRLHSVNFSTGKVMSERVFRTAVCDIATDPTGAFVYVLEASWTLQVLSCDRTTGVTSPLSHLALPWSGKYGVSAEPNCLAYRAYCPPAKGPALLVGRGNASVCLLATGGALPPGTVEVRSQMQSQVPAARSIRSIFCPLVSVDQAGEYVACGGEDTSVYIFDLLRTGHHPVVNRLQGHLAPVVDTSWNGAGTILASCDAGGVVIMWKRRGERGGAGGGGC